MMVDQDPVTRNRALQYLQQQIEQAGPVQQVVMLLDGAIRFTLQARDAITRADIEARHNANKRAMDIVAYLMDILDVEKGGEAATRLRLIYLGIMKDLMQVDFKNDAVLCEEIVGHFRRLRMAWAQMPVGNSAPVVAAPTAENMAAARNAVA